MRLEDILEGLARRGAYTGHPDICEAQARVNTVLTRLGRVSRAFDRWYRTGCIPTTAADEKFAVDVVEVALEALALALNALGTEQFDRLLAERLNTRTDNQRN
jgi:hypothetical protein